MTPTTPTTHTVPVDTGAMHLRLAQQAELLEELKGALERLSRQVSVLETCVLALDRAGSGPAYVKPRRVN